MVRRRFLLLNTFILTAALATVVPPSAGLGAGPDTAPAAHPDGTTKGAHWTMAASTGVYSCGLTTMGALWCWGDNSLGQLGDGSTAISRSPVQVGTLTTWSS